MLSSTDQIPHVSLLFGHTSLLTKLQGKQASELRAIFNISNDFTPEEEAQVSSS
jgi:hypothetical protein